MTEGFVKMLLVRTDWGTGAAVRKAPATGSLLYPGPGPHLVHVSRHYPSAGVCGAHGF